ncbi:MAG TPA: hypothetical protein VMM92_03300 [Thermoanaerobaculia bacterium]|nr:hypothetical protein [Thermoanaerobaculia bacterium]
MRKTLKKKMAITRETLHSLGSGEIQEAAAGALNTKAGSFCFSTCSVCVSCQHTQCLCA